MIRKTALAIMVVFTAATAATADPIFYLVEADFLLQNQNNYLKGTETFEESSIGPGLIEVLDQASGCFPLEYGCQDVFDAFPDGLAEYNLTVQTNSLGGSATVPNLGAGLIVVGAGYISGQTTVIVDLGHDGGNFDSVDLIFAARDTNSVGFTVGSPNRSSGVQIQVYDKNEALLGQVTDWPNDTVPSGTGSFFGVWSSVPIGRINIWHDDSGGSTNRAQEFVDDIQMWFDVSGDCNGNETPDDEEIAADPDLDCNANGIPDECESFLDCNNNQTPDACDEPDFDGDGIPDECDEDIDNDGVPNITDVCDDTSVGLPVNFEGRPRSDINGDCKVDGGDIGVFVQEFLGQ